MLFINLEIDNSDIIEIKIKDLPGNWKSIQRYPTLQKIGSAWYRSEKSLVLQVPSVLVPWESNYLINTNHPDFSKKTSIYSTEEFIWDNRLI
ncbi:RES family NAD+ phosphorylase [Pseudarcicella hirudinis]|uniref:RES family NAD+ phosphorylase n=1 Tax=Pseudarcicella hirudinis TaxID=1079859 RepID=UPI001C43234C